MVHRCEKIFKKFAMPLIMALVLAMACLLLCSCSSSDASPSEKDGQGAQSGTSQGDGDSSKGTTSGPAFEPETPEDAKFDSKSALELSDAKIDISNISKGYVGASADSSSRLKFEVAKDGVSMYFDLPSDGEPVLAPLSLGDGTYEFTVWENTTGQRYAKLAGTTEEVTMSDEFQPFLHSNVYCDFDADGEAAQLASKLVKDAQNEGDALAAIYDWVVNNITYDSAKAEELSGKSGYIPDPDETINEKSGICFDYASLVAAMLRSQGIPCKIVTGNVAPDDIYHAWNMVYIDGTWVNAIIDVQSGTWTRIDSTFSASGADKSFVGDGTNYSDRYTY